MAVQTFNGGSWCWPFMKHILGGTGSLIHSWHYNWHVEGPSYVKVGHRIVYDYAFPFSAKLLVLLQRVIRFGLLPGLMSWWWGRQCVCLSLYVCVCIYRIFFDRIGGGREKKLGCLFYPGI